ncbi:MAG TPA: protein kinase [Polyangia bacterium]|nr:protein kinase [Polyangia bacterium]
MKEGQIIDGRYRLERKIARGGMGEIWAAFDMRLERRVAIKWMTADGAGTSQLRTRSEQEARLIAQLQNPHVVQIFDYGVTDETPYIVMELLDGEDLAARLRRHQRLSLAAVASLLQEIAQALTSAHAARIVHGDLKPANIFLALAGDIKETVKVLDFGVAVLRSNYFRANESTIESPFPAGTPHYMSPEQLSGSDLVPQSDLWSLAVVAYEALTGQCPFTGRNLQEIAFSICHDPVPLLSPTLPGLPTEVDRFFQRALARDPQQRFRSAHEMATAFAALVQSAQRPTKVLVIDDEPDMLLLIEQCFRPQIQNATYQFFFALDGQNAFEQLRQHPDIDVALSDINMPGMDGLTFLRRVGEVHPTLKVVIVSAYSDMLNVRQAMNHGAFDFLVKPVDLQDLELTLDKVSRSAREVRAALRSIEENSLLRMLVHRGLVERLLPIVRMSGAVLGEEIEATVAFINLCGFGPMTAGLPPERAIRRLNTNFDVIASELLAHEGILDKFLGEVAMAVFRGDRHAERALSACVAARECLQRLAAEAEADSPYHLGVAVGVASGRMLSGGIGSQAHGRIDYTVIGDTVQRATRLQQVAERDQILIDQTMYLAVEARFECQLVGSRLLPGSDAPLPVYQVVSRLPPSDPGSTDRNTLAG